MAWFVGTPARQIEHVNSELVLVQAFFVVDNVVDADDDGVGLLIILFQHSRRKQESFGRSYI